MYGMTSMEGGNAKGLPGAILARAKEGMKFYFR
jgi:hypothetical protein